MLTPLHLEILLHYYARADDYPFESNSTRMDYAEHLVADGVLIRGRHDGVELSITPKGRAWIEHILALPWPKQQWVMPTASGE